MTDSCIYIYTCTLPEPVSVLVIGVNRINGHSERNAFAFEDLNLSHVAMIENVEHLALAAYEPDFDRGDYIKKYPGMVDGLDLDTGNRSSARAPSEWSDNFPVFNFRLCHGGLASIPQGDPLDLKFFQPTPRNIIADFYSELPTLLEIEKEKRYDSRIELAAMSNSTLITMTLAMTKAETPVKSIML